MGLNAGARTISDIDKQLIAYQWEGVVAWPPVTNRFHFGKIQLVILPCYFFSIIGKLVELIKAQERK